MSDNESNASEASAQELPALEFYLYLIGFEDEADRTNLTEDAFQDLGEFQFMEPTDVMSLATSFMKRDEENRCIIFGATRTRRLVSLLHWVKDCNHCGEDPIEESFSIEAGQDSFQRAAEPKE